MINGRVDRSTLYGVLHIHVLKGWFQKLYGTLRQWNVRLDTLKGALHILKGCIHTLNLALHIIHNQLDT